MNGAFFGGLRQHAKVREINGCRKRQPFLIDVYVLREREEVRRSVRDLLCNHARTLLLLPLCAEKVAKKLLKRHLLPHTFKVAHSSSPMTRFFHPRTRGYLSQRIRFAFHHDSGLDWA